MPSRAPTLIVLGVLLLGLATAEVAAQPMPPAPRPRANPLQNLFFPGTKAVPNAGLGGTGALAARSPAATPVTPVGVGQTVLLKGADGKTTRYLMIPLESRPAVYASYGHWYTRGGNLGHWYPGGFKGGLGVLAAGSGGGLSGFTGPLATTTSGLFSGSGSFPTGPGMGGFGPINPQPTPAFGLRLGGR